MESKILRNPNNDLFSEITDAIIQNKGYCCCEIEKNDDTKCMCKSFREQSYGACNCGRFIKVPNGKIITLSGSTKFKDTFLKVAGDLTKEGNVVLMPHVFAHADGQELSPAEKDLLDSVHLEKIAMSDELFVINQDNYIGESTRKEINFAELCGVEVKYMEAINENI